jgi:hypothetical protein
MNIRIDPIAATVRFYKEKIQESTPLQDIVDPYYKTLTLIFMDNGDVRATACAEALTMEEIKSVMKKLREMGCKRALWRHHDKENSIHL